MGKKSWYGTCWYDPTPPSLLFSLSIYYIIYIFLCEHFCVFRLNMHYLSPCLCFDLRIGQKWQGYLFYQSSVIIVRTQIRFTKFCVAWLFLPPPPFRPTKLGLTMAYRDEEVVWPLFYWNKISICGKGRNMFCIDILETRSSPHKGSAITDITSKMITEMAYKW